MLQDILRGLKELTFPDNCVLCRQFLNSGHQKQLCPSCLSKIKRNSPPFCLRCSRHLDLPLPDGFCPNCQRQIPAFDRAYSACVYDEALHSLIHQFKYHGKTGLTATFCVLMTEFIQRHHVPLNEFDLLVPIPLHPARFRERGYNQSALLAHALSRACQVPAAPGAMSRVKHTETQTALKANQRWTNLSGAFKINHPWAVADKSVLIVDDLLTTSATADAAASALKDAGAAYVGVFTVAVTE